MMPIYEYVCQECHRRSGFLIRTAGDSDQIVCSHCQSHKLQRIMSRFSAVRSEESRLENLADPNRWSGLDENDPASVAKFVKHMGSEMGEEMSRDDIDQMADEAAREAESGMGAGDDSTASTGHDAALE
jgi:putative FmdB family regulatory protein